MSLLNQFIQAKNQGRKWTMLTAYDAPTAELLENAGIDLILVGDSLGMVLLGYPSTREVTMDEMIHHAKAARRGARHSLIVGDLPLKGIEKGPRQALASARRFIKEAHLDAVKLEWGKDAVEIMKLFSKHRIPVMGHVGLTPQTVKGRDGFKVRGREALCAMKIFMAAKTFEANGAFSVVLECIPKAVASIITGRLKIPTIGIGAGPACDGQVLVFQDLAGIFKKFHPRFVKRYADLDRVMRRAVESYKQDVLSGKFPKNEHSFSMKTAEFDLFLKGACV